MGTKEKLKAHIEFCERNNEDMDATSWGMEEGVIISGNEAKTFLKLIEQSTSQKETIEGLKMSLENLYDAAFTAVSHVAVANYQSREIEAKNLIRTAYEQAEQLLKETEPIDQ